ncbi:MAG: glycosyltransferase family 2 protein [Rhodocyclales bacterium]|nr:glycosyltransferase family 2 protein [Rhodocyclales bacterium]
MSEGPYFSIGVTTFKRRELLTETLSSILAQTFTDFEVIVGNDNTAESLTQEILGIDDPRVRIVNHAVNLGEIANMNELLAQSRGRYFTWLADDDLYAPDFLQAVWDAHRDCGQVSAVFTGYASGEHYDGRRVEYEGTFRQYRGRDFLGDYLARRIKVIGCYGIFEIQSLRSIGGMQQLGQGFSPYSDNLLAIGAGSLKCLCYIDAPLIFFRTHPQSISYSSPDLDAYLSAQDDLCARALEIFKIPQLQPDMQLNLYELLSHWCLTFAFSVLGRSRNRRSGYILDYLRFLGRYSVRLGGIHRIRLAALALHLSLRHWIIAPLSRARPRSGRSRLGLG